MFMDSY